MSNPATSPILDNPLTSYLRDDPVRSLLRSVYGSDTPRNVFSVVSTGGGGAFGNWCFSTPGSSRSIMSFEIPYSRAALTNYVYCNSFSGSKDFEHPPALGCTKETALILSKAACHNAANNFLRDESSNIASLGQSNIFGVSCTAALVSEEVKNC